MYKALEAKNLEINGRVVRMFKARNKAIKNTNSRKEVSNIYLFKVIEAPRSNPINKGKIKLSKKLSKAKITKKIKKPKIKDKKPNLDFE